MADYSKQVASAVATIQKKGAAILVRRYGRDPSPDPSKPWLPGTKVTIDAAAHAVFLGIEQSEFRSRAEADTQERDQTRVPEATMVAYVAGGAVAFEITTGMKIVRAGVELEVLQVGKLQPAEQVILYTLQLKE